MAPAVLDEVSAAVKTNIPDDAVEAHLKDLGAGEGALPDQPNKENIIVRHDGGGVSNRSEPTVIDDDDLFEDEDGEELDDEDDGFVPRGTNYTPTATPKTTPVRPLKPGQKSSTVDTSKTHDQKKTGSDAAPATGKSKDAKGKKKDVKTA